MKLRPSRRDLITGAAALAAYSQIGDARAQTARRVLLGGAQVTLPPNGFVYLLGADGAYLLGADGAHLLGVAP